MIGKAGTSKLALESDSEVRTKSVIVAENVTKRFGERAIIRNFSLRIQRGDRIGVVGANGAGKTTLLKLLTGELEPDEGTVILAKTLHGVMIDQQRSLLSPDKKVRDVLAEGGDWIDVRGVRKHVQAYLKDFLFEPSLVDTPIADYDGTVLIVSHDRDFLDRTVTVTLGLDGSGTVDIVAGGYADWEAKRKKPAAPRAGGAGGARDRKPAPADLPTTPPPPASGRGRVKLSYKDQRDYDLLPARIEELDAEIAKGEHALADPDLYSRDPEMFARHTERLDKLRSEKETAEERWLTLAEMVDG